jgi:hypothetical protein
MLGGILMLGSILWLAALGILWYCGRCDWN